MKILVIALNYAPEPIGCAKYTTQLCVELVRKYAHDLSVYSAAPYYPDWEVYADYDDMWSQKSVEEGVQITRMRVYVPKNPSISKRILHLVSFGLRLVMQFFNMIKFKPNVVVVILPTIVSVPIAKILCVITKAKLHLHVQDLEFGAGKSISIQERKSRFLFSALKLISRSAEHILFKAADGITTISDAMKNRINENLVNTNGNVGVIRNWHDTQKYECDDYFADLRESKKIALYSGAIGKKQGLEIILEVAAECRKDKLISDWVFIIAGDGSQKDILTKKVKVLGLNNVIVRDLFSNADYLHAFKSADVHIIPQLPGVGDYVLPSKLSTLWGLGCRTIVAASAKSEISKMNNKFPGLCSTYLPGSNTSLRSALTETLEKPFDHKVCMEFAAEFLDKGKNIAAFENYLKKIVNNDEKQ